jgi:predicted nucleic acid-binding protein
MSAEKPHRAYFDTSVLSKRYLNEERSSRARALLRQFTVVSSTVSAVEVVSAMARQRAAGLLQDHVFSAILARLATDRRNWELVELDSKVIESAERVVRTGAIRTLDALHVGSAIALAEHSRARLRFVTADIRQGKVANEFGLEVIQI